MDSSIESRPGGRKRRRHRARTLAALTAALLAAGAAPGLGGTATAIPPDCPDGGPPPCYETDPDPTEPPDTTPHPTAWTSLVSVLDQSEEGYLHDIRGAWVGTGSPIYATRAGSLVWTNVDQTRGRIEIPGSVSLPAPSMGFHLWENSQNVDGSLCRSAPVPAVELVLASTHVLVAEKVTTTPEELQTLAGGFVGDASTPDAEIRIDAITLEPIDGALHLVIEGWMFADGPLWFNAEGDFRYTGDLSVLESERAETDKFVSVHADNDSLVIFGEDADIEAQVLPKFRMAVNEKVTNAINAQVTARPQVQWFASLGFTTSFRDVSIDTAGLHVLPSLCKVA